MRTNNYIVRELTHTTREVMHSFYTGFAVGLVCMALFMVTYIIATNV